MQRIETGALFNVLSISMDNTESTLAMTLKPHSIPLGGVLLAAVFLATPPIIQPLMAAAAASCRNSVTCTMSNDDKGQCGDYNGGADCVCIHGANAEHQSACFE